MNNKMYEKTEGAFKLFLKSALNFFLIPVVWSLSPFIVVAYYWCLGKYTIDSWFFFYSVW